VLYIIVRILLILLTLLTYSTDDEGTNYIPEVASSIPDEVTGIFNLLNPSSRTISMRSTEPLTEMDIGKLPGGKEWPARKADNFTATCKPTVKKM
jgi:hypothetical protein